MSYSVEIFGSSIVQVGSFNPSIFSVDWFETNKLIGQEDAEAARGSASLLVSRQVSAFETDWFSLQVLENQLTLSSKGPLTPAFRDIAESIATLLPHTPVTALGLNFLGHYKLSTEAEYHRFGDALVPKNIWNELIDVDNEFAGVGDVTVRVQRGERYKSVTEPDHLNVQVQPSGRVKFGVFLSCNNHRESFARMPGGKPTAQAASGVIIEEWQALKLKAETIFDGLLNKASAERGNV